jgi:hypothetical protein
VGPVRIPEEAVRDTLQQTCVFPSDAICGSRSAFRCVQGVKRQSTIFLAPVGPVRTPQKARRYTLQRTCILHLVGTARHVVHSGESGCEISTHYISCSGRTGTDSTKSASVLLTLNLCFCIRSDLQAMLLIPARLGHETSMHHFSCSGGTSTDSTKERQDMSC